MGVESGSPEIACSTDAKGPTAEASSYQPTITTGGGFSKVFGRPYWQPQWSQALPGTTIDGRGVPDVSLAGHAYVVSIGGHWVPLDGTSASAPAFAGMVSVFNALLNTASTTSSQMDDVPDKPARRCDLDTGGRCSFTTCSSWRGPVTCHRYGFSDNRCVCKQGFCPDKGVCRPEKALGRKLSVGWLNPVLYKYPSAFTDIKEGSNKCGVRGQPCCGGYDATEGWDPVTGLGTVNAREVMKILGISA